MTIKTTRAESFAKILEFCTEFKDARDIAKHLKITEMTARKYMKILIDAKYVTSKQKSLKFNTMRQIQSRVKDLTQLRLLNLSEKFRAKFAVESVTSSTIRNAKVIEAQAEAEAIQFKDGNLGTVDPVTGARVFLLADTQRWTRQRFGTDKVHASGSSLSMVMATASY